MSNFCNHAMEAVLATAKVKPAVNQFLYHAGMGPDPDGACAAPQARSLSGSDLVYNCFLSDADRL